MKEITVRSPEETAFVAGQLAERIREPVTIAFFGGLGAGKTTFIRAFCEALGVTDDVTSPTFAMVHEYKGRLPVCHFDMYRVETFEDLYSTGYFDYLGSCVMLIEWSENITEHLPEKYIRVEISYGETDLTRHIRMEEIS